MVVMGLFLMCQTCLTGLVSLLGKILYFILDHCILFSARGRATAGNLFYFHVCWVGPGESRRQLVQ